MTPELDDRTRGWLRFIWDKTTTPDDWSSAGEPAAWWDRRSTAPMCTFPRFDLGETGYILPILAELTPAWREVYTRIADELVGRHTTFWAAIDWLTLIGHDPAQNRVPPEWLSYLPDRLRGRYDPPGWTANGVEPWGLQPDPIGADGNLFFRGFFNLLLSIYRSVSGDDKWEKPFQVTGYRDRRFEWTHSRIAEFIHLQSKERPQGPHCENTKIWPFCVSGAGLGLQLYDAVRGTRYHGVYDDWVEFAKRHYLILDSRGRLQTFPFYYDPLEDEICSFPEPMVAFAALAIAPYLVPQNRELGTFLYEESVRMLGWNDPRKPVVRLHPDPRFVTATMLVALDLGDETTLRRLREVHEKEFDPRWFGDEQSRFGWWFGTGEPHPRGQLSALAMVCEAAGTGSWSRVFRAPDLAKFAQPTVEGIDYPFLGIASAINAATDGVLNVATYAATPSRRGAPTRFRVTKLAAPAAVAIWCDDQPFPRWRVVGDDAIEIETEIGEHRYRITTRALGVGDESRGGVRAAASAEPERSYVPAAPASCGSCCPGG